jgi:hypothetical protein
VEDAAKAVQQSITPRRVKTFAKKHKNANKGMDMASEVAKRPRPTRGEYMLGFIGQVKSVFSFLEYELLKDPISTQDAPRVKHIQKEGEVEEMNIDSSEGIGAGRENARHESPQTFSAERAMTPPPPIVQPDSVRVLYRSSLRRTFKPRIINKIRPKTSKQLRMKKSDQSRPKGHSRFRPIVAVLLRPPAGKVLFKEGLW